MQTLQAFLQAVPRCAISLPVSEMLKGPSSIPCRFQVIVYDALKMINGKTGLAIACAIISKMTIMISTRSSISTKKPTSPVAGLGLGGLVHTPKKENNPNQQKWKEATLSKARHGDPTGEESTAILTQANQPDRTRRQK